MEHHMATIDVDFEVFKAITVLRDAEEVSPNDVLRRLLKLPTSGSKANGVAGGGWSYKGVVFPNGTVFRKTYKNKIYTAEVVKGQLLLDGKPMKSPSEAAMAITKSPVNGWTFWQCKFPDSHRWLALSRLRAKD
jgi:hypothetical protein